MKNFDWKRIVPHAIAIGIFLVVALVYCKPAMQGKVLQQSDITQWKAMSKDIYNYKEVHGESPLWTNGMFSGMPGYLIATRSNNQLPYYFAQALSLFLPKPFQFFFLACVCFYFLSQVLRVNTWVGVIGALCYAYATYNPIIVAEGHDTKMLSIALLPGFIASIVLIYDKRYWWGAAATALFSGALISQNHYQITYYGLIIAVMMTIGFIVYCVRTKQLRHLVVAGGVTLAAGLIGTLSNAVVIFPNYEYTQETIRGGSELADAKSNIGKEGLSKDYAFSYSMNKTEFFALMTPRIFGGSGNHMEVAEDKSKAVEALQSMPQELAQNLQGALRFYWGEAHNSGPPYAGAIICFLAIMGFVILDNRYKWWILATVVLTIMMSWGSFFEGFNTFLYQVLPMYNKFRAPGMIIVVPTLLLGMMAILTLQKLLFGYTDSAALLKDLKKGLIATGGVFVVLLAVYFSLDYSGQVDQNMLAQIAQIPDPAQKAAIEPQVRSFVNGLREDRQGLFMGDIMRSFFFIAIAAGALWLFQRKVFKPAIALVVIGLMSFIDLMAIDVKYLNADNYQEREEYEGTFTPSPADLQILQDKSYYRVLDVAGGDIGNAFNHGALPSYFHKSIGGYHPAKLSIYQDLIEKQLYKFPNCQPVINMLNTKYIIYGERQSPQVQLNPGALGAAWFVKGIRVVNTPQEEISALDNLDTRDSAVINKTFADRIKTVFTPDTSATITLVKNENDIVTYKSKSATEQPAVFSEIYYDKGWNVYVDDKKVDYAKVNYVLRGMMVPAGEHTIVFKFEPRSHAIGWTLTTIASILMLLLLLAAIYFDVKQRKADVQVK
ncbi:hypothetical protein EXU57_01895 [Segetibacter sp. 3557_3]|uniref:YfhO family protein n=1 Tax=Segetibacter sp. 3557_3 TaxID=2547429 RepID=UPI0010590CFB|nr:YfhO family protein [Segetibacter sp. 3557_3]TDH28847.1 hypothetical protein EXU57_01895 [Segetibacter sp. 3557_3]